MEIYFVKRIDYDLFIHSDKLGKIKLSREFLQEHMLPVYKDARPIAVSAEFVINEPDTVDVTKSRPDLLSRYAQHDNGIVLLNHHSGGVFVLKPSEDGFEMVYMSERYY
jgi:hypothetical protein